MTTTNRKRCSPHVRSGSAEHELITTKKFLVDKENNENYKYKTLCSDVYFPQDISDDNIIVKLKKDVEYKFQRRLRKPFLFPLGERSFAKTLDQCLEMFGKRFSPPKPPPKGVDKLFVGLKKKIKLTNLMTALESGCTEYSELGKRFGFSGPVVRQMALRLEKRGEIEATKCKKPKKLNENHFNYLKHLMDDPKNCFMTLNEIRESLTSNFNLEEDSISIYTVHKALKYLGVTFNKNTKLTDKRNKEDTKIKRKLAAQYLLSSIQRNHDIVFLDEVGFNVNMTPLYGYSKKGKNVQL